jgi:hypothetical protein
MMFRSMLKFAGVALVTLTAFIVLMLGLASLRATPGRDGARSLPSRPPHAPEWVGSSPPHRPRESGLPVQPAPTKRPLSN